MCLLVFIHSNVYAKPSADYITEFDSPYAGYLAEMRKAPDLVLKKLLANPPVDDATELVLAQYYGCLGQAYYSLTYPQLSLENAQLATSYVAVDSQPWLAHNLQIFESLSFEMVGLHADGLPLVDQAIHWAEQQDDLGTLLLGLYSRGIIQTSLTNYTKALADFQRAYNLVLQQETSISAADILSMQAQIYEYRGEPEFAIPLFEQAETFFRETQEWGELSIVLYGLGKANRDIGNNQLGRTQLQESLALAEKINDQQGVAYALKDLARMNMAENKFALAELQLQDALDILETADNRHLTFIVLVNMAELNLLQKRSSAAKGYLQQAESYLDRKSMPIHAMDFDQIKAELFVQLGQYEQAYTLLQSSFMAYKTYTNLESSQQLHKLRVQSELEASNRQNLVLSHQNELQALELANHQKQNLNFYLIIFLALCACILLGVIVYRNIGYNRVLKLLANTDELTGLANRRQILDQLKIQLNQSHRYQSDLSVAMIDLDWFKQINDRFGHFTGDKVLKLFAKVCDDNLRQADVIGRVGGEEFLVILPYTDSDGAYQVMESLREKMTDLSEEINLPNLSVTISVGICQCLPEDKLEEVIQLADSALYRAKQSGRDMVVACDRRANLTHQ